MPSSHEIVMTAVLIIRFRSNFTPISHQRNWCSSYAKPEIIIYKKRSFSVRNEVYTVKSFFFMVSCEERSVDSWFHSVLERAGNGRVALQIILKQLHDIEEAIRFCRDTGDQSLWNALIQESVDKPGSFAIGNKIVQWRDFSSFRFHSGIVESRRKWCQSTKVDSDNSRENENYWPSRFIV